MFQTLVSSFKNKDIRRKILITLGLLFIYRVGCYIPVPGISSEVYSVVDSDGVTNTMLTLLSSLTGGALANGALFAIGISPYINASIITQLLTVASKKMSEWSKQGDDGKRKIATVTRVLTLVLATAQAAGIVVSWANDGGLNATVFGSATPQWLVAIFVAIILMSGSMLTMWIGERITELGIGNGISLLIFVGILSSAGMALLAVCQQIPTDETGTAVWQLIGFLLLVIAIFTFIVWIDLAERRIPIQYAKQVKGRKQYGGQSTFIPIKINASGVLPIIFANAIITFPQLIFSMFMATDNSFYIWWMTWLGSGTVIYFILVGLLVLFFSYFYAQIQFNPEEVSRNIQQYGGFVPGIRPGRPTQEYLTKVTRRITLWGALFLAFIAIVPSIIFAIVLPDATLVNSFTATGMLIVVSVALEFEKQLQSQLMMKQYKGFLK